MSNLKETIAHRMKVLRAEARMSQEDLAEAAGISSASIKNYETGASQPLLETACSLAKALGCTPNDLCGWPKR